jgi:hypothetical protein
VPGFWNKYRKILGGAVLLAALALRLSLFVTGLNHVPVSTDESITALQAIGLTQSPSHPVYEAKQNPRGLGGRFPLLFMGQPYLFPLESYLMAPGMPFLPSTPLGARWMAGMLGLLGVVFTLLLLRRWGGRGALVLGGLLVLFPSAYLLIYQAGYALPSYPVLLAFSAGILWLTQTSVRDERPRPVWMALAGLVAGLTMAVNLLALPVVLAAAAWGGLGRNRRQAFVHLPVFVFFFMVGFSPYFVAQKLYPGAFGAVSTLIPWGHAVRKLWDPTLSFTLPVACGVEPSYWPDNRETLVLIPGLRPVFSVLWLGLLLAATGTCLVRFLRRLRAYRWPVLEGLDAVVVVNWVALILFVTNSRSLGDSFRYLLQVVWTWPLLVAGLYSLAPRPGRWFLGALTGLLVIVNLAGAVGVIRQWRRPDFAANEAWLGDLRPVNERLDREGIRHCYASYHLAYRITYATRERILGAQFFNERFPGWPLPYKDAVDQSPAVAFVFSPRFSLKVDDIARDLAEGGIRFQRDRVGEYEMLYGFEGSGSPLTFPTLTGSTARVSHQLDRAGSLTDGRLDTWWRAGAVQSTQMWVECHQPTAQWVRGIRLDTTGYPYDNAGAVRVLIWDRGGWKEILPSTQHKWDAVAWENGHPALGCARQTLIWPESVLTDAVRVEITEPATARDWTLSEIVLLAPPASL